MSRWDPIGVADEPMAWDEYDGYIGGVVDLLKRDAKDQEIADHLRSIEVERMGLIDEKGHPLIPEQRRRTTVIALRSLQASTPDIPCEPTERHS